MIFNLFLTIFIAFEIQKLFQFNLFFRLKTISHDYKNILNKKTNSIAYTEIIKLGLVDILYSIICVIGLFTINEYFFCGIFLISLIQNFIFNNIKNKIFRKITHTLDILLSIALLSLSLLNSIQFKLDDIQLIKHLLNLC